MSRRRRKGRAERQMQLLLRILIFVAVASVIFFFALNRARNEREAEAGIEKTEDVSGDAWHAVVTPTPGEEMTSSEDESLAGTQATATPTLTATPTPQITVDPEIERQEKERTELLAMPDEQLAEELRRREVPEDLVAFMEDYPEATEFVVDYLYRPEKALRKDVHGEVVRGVVPHFLQWDPRWGYDYYDDSFFAVAGCGPTALSEVYCGLTGKSDMNPYEMGVWATDMGYHIRGQGTSWDMMGAGAQILGLNAWSVAINADAIISTLREGYPIICAVSPGDFTHFGHFIVLAEVDDQGNISVRDSNSKVRTARTWTTDELLWQISGMWAYSYDG